MQWRIQPSPRSPARWRAFTRARMRLAGSASRRTCTAESLRAHRDRVGRSARPWPCRCALVTSFESFKYIVMYSMIQFGTVMQLYQAPRAPARPPACLPRTSRLPLPGSRMHGAVRGGSGRSCPTPPGALRLGGEAGAKGRRLRRGVGGMRRNRAPSSSRRHTATC